MKNKEGLPYITIIEKLMDGDEDVRNLYSFNTFRSTFNQHVETTDFKYDSEVLTHPDAVSFDYGVKWRKEYIPFYKIQNPDWKRDFCEYGESILISSLFYEDFCENIEFVYNKGRAHCKMDDVFDNLHFVKKIDIVDRCIYIEPNNHHVSFELFNVMLQGTQREDDGKQIDKLSCDWYRINLK